MKSSFNPFFELIEAEHTPWARSFRSSFKKKLRDTFFIFHGMPLFFLNKPYTGFFDYATLFIPWLLVYLNDWCFDVLFDKKAFWGNKILVALIIFPLLLINLGLYLGRFLTAALFTLAVTPLVYITHQIFHYLAREDKQQIDNMDILGTNEQGEITQLKQTLINNQLTVDDFHISCERLMFPRSESQDIPENYALIFRWKNPPEPNRTVFFTGRLESDNPGIPSLFKHNIWQIVTHVEKQKSMPEAVLNTLLNG